MRVRFEVSIASGTWSYVPQQEVEVGGREYTPTAIPDDIAAAWLSVGHVTAIVVEPSTATVRPAEKAVRRGRA